MLLSAPMDMQGLSVPVPSAMAGINAEAEQREQLIAETEQRITGLHDHIYTSCIIDGNQFLVNGSNKIYCRYAL